MKNIAIPLLLFLLVLVAFPACSQGEDEKAFKNIALELKELLVGIDSIPNREIKGYDRIVEFYNEHPELGEMPERMVKVGESNDPMDRQVAGSMTMFDMADRREFYEKSREDWVSVANGLEEFHTAHPKSVWADDALFMISVIAGVEESLLLSYNHDVALRSMKRIVEGYDRIELESWTRSNFNKVFLDKTEESCKYLFGPDVPIDTALHDTCTFKYGLMLKADGYDSDAEEVLEGLLLKYKDCLIEQLIRQKLEGGRQP